jgi:hypothetical protein
VSCGVFTAQLRRFLNLDFEPGDIGIHVVICRTVAICSPVFSGEDKQLFVSLLCGRIHRTSQTAEELYEAKDCPISDMPCEWCGGSDLEEKVRSTPSQMDVVFLMQVCQV